MNSKDMYDQLSKFGKELLNKTTLEDGLMYISEFVKNSFKANRCSIFIYNLKSNELWTTMSDDVKFVTFFAHYISIFIELNNLYKVK